MLIYFGDFLCDLRGRTANPESTAGGLRRGIMKYIDYYNNRIYQKRLKSMTPLEYRKYLLEFVA